MKTSTLKYLLLTWVSGLAMLIIFFVPFDGFLTVFANHLFGHYTADRLWDEGLLAICLIGVTLLLLLDPKIRFQTLSRRLVWLIIAYSGLNLLLGGLSYMHHQVTLKALGYGLIVNLRFPLFFLVTWSVAIRLARLRRHWQWLVTIPAGIVIAFGLLQVLVLPTNFLSHFGYSSQTISPYETINHNVNYVRYASLTRGANPLGAYLLIPLSLVTALLLTKKRSPSQTALLSGGLILLVFTFSRSAWLGAVLSLGLLVWLRFRERLNNQLIVPIIVVLVVLGGTAYGLRNNVSFENFIFHTQHHSKVSTNSDQGHLSATESGLKDMVKQPLGRGPGTAGPASIYNHNKVRIAEDYYIQIGQETGWLGLGLFLLINIGLAYLLWTRRSDFLALSLLASLIGISLVNLFSHAWTDDTLSYVWWGLAGIAMSQLPIGFKSDSQASYSMMDEDERKPNKREGSQAHQKAKAAA